MALPTTISLTAEDPTKSTTESTSNGGVIPMSMPSILTNPRIKQLQSRTAPTRKGDKLHGDSTTTAPGGKRRRRRHENAQLAGNPHITRPSRSDYAPGPPVNLSTIFAPPPAAFPRSLYIPSSTPSLALPSSHGQFSLSLRGVRKTIRRMMTGSERRGEGGRTEEVLRIMEGELREWCGKSGRLEEGYYHSTSVHGLGRVLDPTPIDEGQWSKPTAETTLPDLPTHSHSSTPVPATAPPTLTELSRTPHSLLWLLPSPHTRYLAHVLARYYSLTSFSRPLSPLEPSIRVTHIARPHLVNPLEGRGVEVLGLETPPGTDWSDVGGGGGTTTGGEEMTSGSEIERRRGGEMGTDTDTDSEAGDWESLGRGRGRGPLAVGEEVVLVSSSGRDWAPSEFESSEEGGTGDEASSFGDEDELEEEGGVDSLASSFADLRARVDQDDEEEEDDPTPNPTRTTTLPFTSLPPDFALHSGSSTPRPLPLRARLPRESFPPPSATSSTVPTRPAPVPRGVSTDSSSWERDASPVRGMGRLVGGGGRQGQGQGQGQGWSMPEQTFGEWLFA